MTSGGRVTAIIADQEGENVHKSGLKAMERPQSWINRRLRRLVGLNLSPPLTLPCDALWCFAKDIVTTINTKVTVKHPRGVVQTESASKSS